MLKNVSLSTCLLVFVLLGCTKDEAANDNARAKAEPAKETAAPEAAKPQVPAENAEAEIPNLSVDEVATLLGEKKAVPVDANSVETRSKYGVLPGAVLTSKTEDDLAKVLPENRDAKLVFYCANTNCGASKRGAKKAILAGYKDVAVMEAGIMGWKDAGKPTDKI